MDAVALLVTTSFRHVINEPNIEAGYARFREVAAAPIDETAFRDAVATALRERLIREPVRLPEGALQCHWHLELTPKGVDRARSLVATDAGQSSIPRNQPSEEEVVDGRAKPGHDG